MHRSLVQFIIKNLESLTSLVIIAFFLNLLLFPYLAFAGALTSYADTLTNSRPSVATTVSGSFSSSSTTITVASTSGINLNDTVLLCTTSACTTTETKVVASVINPTTLAFTVGTTNALTASSFLYLLSTSKHTITFTTRSAVTSGKFIITLPGDSGGANNLLPGTGGFDFNKLSTSTDVTLTGGTAGVIATSTSGTNLVITIPFTGTVASNTAITIGIGNVNFLLNPTKTAVSGTADTWNVETDEADSGSNIIDTTTGQIGTIEAVSVSATVTPSLSFIIGGVNNAISVAGTTTTSTTTPTTAPFGNLTIATNYTLAQTITVSTNSNSGYIVTTQEDGYLRKTNGTYIPDFGYTPAENNTNNGFGFAMQNATSTPATAGLLYNASARTFNSQGFSSTSPTTIMSNSSPDSGDAAYVVYRVRVPGTQAQGVYQNLITYIATATY